MICAFIQIGFSDIKELIMDVSEIITSQLSTEVKTEEDRIALASSITGYFEEITQALENLDECISTLPEDPKKGELSSHSNKIKSLVDVMFQTNLPVHTSLSKRPYKSAIERLGLSGPVIQARENGMSIRQISDLYKLKRTQVSKFFQVYDQASPIQQKNLKDSSIFNTTERLEEVTQIIQHQLARLQDRDPKNHVLYTKQLLDCIRLASELTEKVAIHQQLQALIQEVSAILIEEIPDKNSRIRTVKRLESVKQFQFVLEGN